MTDISAANSKRESLASSWEPGLPTAAPSTSVSPYPSVSGLYAHGGPAAPGPPPLQSPYSSFTQPVSSSSSASSPYGQPQGKLDHFVFSNLNIYQLLSNNQSIL